MKLDIVDTTMAAIRAAGIADVCRRLSDDREAVAVRKSPSPTPRAYFDGALDSNLLITVYVKREDEEQAQDEAEAIEKLLREDPPDSANGSYALTSADVSTARSVNWDEKGYYLWVVEMTAHTTRKD